MLKALFGYQSDTAKGPQVDPAPVSADGIAREASPTSAVGRGAANPASPAGLPAHADGADTDGQVAVPGRSRLRLTGDLDSNQIKIGENIVIIGEIRGHGNVIQIEGTRNPQKIYVNIHGNHNRLVIGRRSLMQSLRVDIGSRRWLSSHSRLIIGEHFSIGSKGRFLLPNSGNVIEIGNHCMFSSSVQLRGGEYPHLIFDKETGENLDQSEGIYIGDHAWIGEGVFIAKSVTIPSDTIVGARSVVTKRFAEQNTVIAGNPARVVKRGVQWVANEFVLEARHPDLVDKFREPRTSRLKAEEPENAANADDAL